MKVGIMQPYFLPYLGYWQLMNAVDRYIILDDVSFIRRGWIHRNRIQNHGEVQWLTIPITGASQNRTICELNLARSERVWHKLRRSVQLAYCHAPQYALGKAVFDRILDFRDDNLSQFLTNSIYESAFYLAIDTEIVRASDLEYDRSLRGSERILELCARMGADSYYNAIGGQELYDADLFAARGIDLRFLRMKDDLVYPQGKHGFCPRLSVLDAMMYNDTTQLRQLLLQFTLEEGKPRENAGI